MSIPAAWHPDPTGRHEHRYWDGEKWTEHVADAGHAAIDPLDAAQPATTAETAADEPQEEPHIGAGASSSEPDISSGAADELTSDPIVEQPEATAPAEQPDAGATQVIEPVVTPVSYREWEQPASTTPPATQTGGGAGGYPPTTGGYPPATGGYPGASGAYPTAAAPAPAIATNGAAVAALVLGIISLVVSVVPVLGVLGIIGGITALILGIVGRKRAIREGAPRRGAAVGGIVTGVIAIIIGVVMLILTIWFFQTYRSDFADLVTCIEETSDTEACSREFERSVLRRFGR